MHDRLTSRYLFKVLVPTEVSAHQTRPRSHPEQRLQPRHHRDHWRVRWRVGVLGTRLDPVWE